MKALLKRVNWVHVLGLAVTLGAAALTEISGVRHTVIVVALTGVFTRLDKIVNKSSDA